MILHDFFLFNRPISPHLTVYVPQQSSIFSIWHRISGILVLFSLFLLLNFFNNLLLCNPQNLLFEIYFNVWLKLTRIGFLLFLIILFYHMINGLCHIIWDLGTLLNKNIFYYLSFFIVIVFLIGLIIL
uniref:Succinate:cytochrome c oxidoreductase subunit 3 n=1 Tax=Pterocladiella luxurians TaxID=2909240 RepID=A0A1D8X7C7_9FLOR|nr:succinate:cytochrome c oxidoreductase subunit 3 [Gelidium crinale f. luxurians]